MTAKHNSAKYLANVSKEIDDALIASCLKKGSPQAFAIYYKVTGRMVDKTEIKEINTVSADEHYAIAEAAKRKTRQQEERNFEKVTEGIDFSKWPLPPAK